MDVLYFHVSAHPPSLSDLWDGWAYSGDTHMWKSDVRTGESIDLTAERRLKRQVLMEWEVGESSSAFRIDRKS